MTNQTHMTDPTLVNALARGMADDTDTIIHNAECLYYQSTGKQPPHIEPVGPMADLLVAYMRAGALFGLTWERS